MCSALSTTIAVQEHYASDEGLAMMHMKHAVAYASDEGLAMIHMKHAVAFGGAIVHLCLDQWCTSGAQDRCSGGRFQLN